MTEAIADADRQTNNRKKKEKEKKKRWRTRRGKTPGRSNRQAQHEPTRGQQRIRMWKPSHLIFICLSSSFNFFVANSSTGWLLRLIRLLV